MLDIKDYKDKRAQIVVNSEEEYQKLRPLLNSIWRGWHTGIYDINKSKEGKLYINCPGDCCDSTPYPNRDSIEASEFFEKSDKVINNYTLY